VIVFFKQTKMTIRAQKQLCSIVTRKEKVDKKNPVLVRIFLTDFK
jgi:hypothetical protein